jgi:hypothetical protein
MMVPMQEMRNVSINKVISDLGGRAKKKGDNIEVTFCLQDLPDIVSALAEGKVLGPVPEEMVAMERLENPRSYPASDVPQRNTASTQAWSKDVSALELEALRVLMGGDFDQVFHVDQAKGRSTMSLKGATSEDWASKAEMLRREDFPLSAKEVATLGDVVDVKADGIEAFIKTIPSMASCLAEAVSPTC